jgi:hypothetical protein
MPPRLSPMLALMKSRPLRSSLCQRCGAILPDVEPPASGSIQRAGPECGAGYSTQRLAFLVKGEPLAARQANGTAQPRRPDLHGRGSRVLHDCTFPLYGLDGTWKGQRWFGGSGGSRVLVDRVELGHGDVWDDHGPLVRVETFRSIHIGRGVDRLTARRLANQLWRKHAYVPFGRVEGVAGDVVRARDSGAVWAVDTDGPHAEPWPLLARGCSVGSGTFRVLLGRRDLRREAVGS